MTIDAMAFHTTLQESEAKRPASLTSTHAIVGTKQATRTTATLKGGRVEFLDTYRRRRPQRRRHGPGRCRMPSRRSTGQQHSPPLPRISTGSLQRNRAALEAVRSILTARPLVVREAIDQVGLRVTVPEIAMRGKPVTVEVTPTESGTLPGPGHRHQRDRTANRVPRPATRQRDGQRDLRLSPPGRAHHRRVRPGPLAPVRPSQQ